jgi:hypothetical protein
MPGSSQTLGQALRQLSAVEGVLRRTHRHLHVLAQAELLAADLNGYANLREHWAHSLWAVISILEQLGVRDDVFRTFAETVQPIPDEFWAYAVSSPPNREIHEAMAEMFPEWMRAFEGTMPLMEAGPTSVQTADAFDADSTDVIEVVRRLEAAGYDGILEAPAAGELFGIHLDSLIVQSVRMAAMYDLYIDIRMNTAPPIQVAPRRSLRLVDPAWIMLGLGLATGASYAAGEVLKARAKAKKRMSVKELSELIKKSERS